MKTPIGFLSLTSMAVAAFTAATACSHSIDEPAPAEDSRITFEVETSSMGGDTKSNGITTTENIPEFKIWAYDYGLFTYLMKGVSVIRTGINSWSYSPAVDWTGNMMCFTAVSPVSTDINVNPWWLDMIPYKNEGNEDLLVCRVTNVRQTSGRLKLHFYHALSMVDVRLHAKPAQGKVRIKSATIVNVSDIGQFRFPSEGFNTSTTLEKVSDCWDIYGQSNRIPVFISDEGTLLDDKVFDADNQGYDFFIPSLLAPFDFDKYYSSSYLEIDYLIEDNDGSVIWPDKATDYRLVSVNNPGYGQIRLGLGDTLPGNRWLSGKRYRYNVDLSYPAVVPPGAASDASRSIPGSVMTVDVTNL